MANSSPDRGAEEGAPDLVLQHGERQGAGAPGGGGEHRPDGSGAPQEAVRGPTQGTRDRRPALGAPGEHPSQVGPKNI